MGKDIRVLTTLRYHMQDQIGWRPTPRGMKTVSDSAEPGKRRATAGTAVRRTEYEVY